MLAAGRQIAILRWFLIWTTIGCLFSLQLRWHYDLPWSLSVFWGLADWYLWGLLALAIFAGVRALKRLGWESRWRFLLYMGSAPVAAGIHVVLTMIVGGSSDALADAGWVGFFYALYAKKLTLNILTFGVLTLVAERLSAQPPAQASGETKAEALPARIGETTRLINPKEIFWGEVSGNYVDLHTRDGVWPVRITLTQLLHRLVQHRFLQVSRSRLINLDQVRAMKSDSGTLSVVLSDGSEIQVARRHGSRVRKTLREFCGLEDPGR
ncbi:MAG: LytTR family transcriptional regulator DNA-binding domain-containing protein [Xanthomonadales bacterium]|nr:LytTR family transcriptional regulator DNA-binding domain-containing protein [Xanthomonadales bacterium]